MKILVTGGAGFIGSHLTETLVKKGHEVTVIDDLSTGHISNLNNVIEKITLLPFDISKHNFTMPNDFELIFHLASKPWSMSKNYDDMFHSNVVGTYNILCETPMIFTSSANVYGSGRFFKVGDPLKNVSFYGYTKILAEQVIHYSKNPYIIFRLGTVIGTRGRCFPNRLVWCAVNDVPIEVFNFGDTLRDIIDVRDVVNALLKAPELLREEVRPEETTYNLASNTEISGKKLVSLVSSIAKERGYKLKYEFIDFIPNGYVPLSTLITSDLWECKYSLKESLKQLFEYYEKEGSIEPPSWENLQ